MNLITINGVTTSVTGRNVQVKNITNSLVRVTVDGVLISEVDTRELVIKFEGDLANLNATNVNVYGNVTNGIDATNVKVSGDVWGNIDATNVTAGNISGDVDATNIKYNK